jgi:hypothetical protein
MVVVGFNLTLKMEVIMTDKLNETSKLAQLWVDTCYNDTQITSFMVDGELQNNPNMKLLDDPNGDATPVANPYYKIGVVFDAGANCVKAENTVARAKSNLDVKARMLQRHMSDEGIVDVKDIPPTEPTLSFYQIAKGEWSASVAKRAFWYEVFFLAYGVQWSDFDYDGAIKAYNDAKDGNKVLDQSQFDNVSSFAIKK